VRGKISGLYRGDFDLYTPNLGKPRIGFGPGEESCSSTPQEEEDDAADMRALRVSKRRRDGCSAGACATETSERKREGAAGWAGGKNGPGQRGRMGAGWAASGGLGLRARKGERVLSFFLFFFLLFQSHFQKQI